MILGICGSGQLSMGLCLAAKELKIKTIVLSDDKDGPSKNLCDEYIYFNLNEKDKIKSFSEKIDVATMEFEKFDFNTLKMIEQYKPVYPKPEINLLVSSRKKEKDFFNALGIPTTDYISISNKDDIMQNKNLIPGLLKGDFGYDGLSTYEVNSLDDVEKLDIKFDKNFILEKKVNLKKEISVIATRYINGQINIFEPFENVHKKKILRETKVPAEISSNIIKKAKIYTKNILEKHNYIGTMAVEFFINDQNNLLVNESASRPHNSGWITVNASNSSQFSQHVRACCDLEFVPLKKMKKGNMINIIGDEIIEYRKKIFNSREFFFDYKKKKIRPGRKMGHLNTIE